MKIFDVLCFVNAMNPPAPPHAQCGGCQCPCHAPATREIIRAFLDAHDGELARLSFDHFWAWLNEPIRHDMLHTFMAESVPRDNFPVDRPLAARYLTRIMAEEYNAWHGLDPGEEW
jgi:hypothetical protein